MKCKMRYCGAENQDCIRADSSYSLNNPHSFSHHLSPFNRFIISFPLETRHNLRLGCAVVKGILLVTFAAAGRVSLPPTPESPPCHRHRRRLNSDRRRRRRRGGQHRLRQRTLRRCQIAMARFLDRICLAPWASGLWLRYATLQNLIPSFPWIAPGWRARGANFAIWQPCGDATGGRRDERNASRQRSDAAFAYANCSPNDGGAEGRTWKQHRFGRTLYK